MFYYEDEEKRIVYSLTGRGLFSELSNLALALVYADYNQEEPDCQYKELECKGRERLE